MVNIEKLRSTIEVESNESLGKILNDVKDWKDQSFSIYSGDIGCQLFSEVTENVGRLYSLPLVVPELISWYHEQVERGLFDKSILSVARTTGGQGVSNSDGIVFFVGFPGSIQAKGYVPHNGKHSDPYFLRVEAKPRIISSIKEESPLSYLSSPKFILPSGVEIYSEEDLRVYNQYDSYLVRGKSDSIPELWRNSELVFEG